MTKSDSLIFLFLAFFLLSINIPDNGTKFNALSKLESIERDYGISIYTEDFFPSTYAATNAEWEFLDDSDSLTLFGFTDIFEKEWRKYPKDWVVKSNLKAIALVKNLSVNGQNRFAIPDAYGEVLYYDIGYGHYGENYICHSIHHEYYHMIEENYFGSMYYNDPSWLSLNDVGFKYGPGGASAYNDGDFSASLHPFSGFVSSYSTYGIEEDKAEVFAFLLMKNNYLALEEWTASDPILKNKVKYMREFLQNEVILMDSSYFSFIHRL
ncbi:MAG: putative zinc-binding metallopeptidase [Flammeovirgaceae bacterium]|nr:putative zinc-binding metallopeptidase [Flammeovirgaceae bacterium]